MTVKTIEETIDEKYTIVVAILTGLTKSLVKDFGLDKKQVLFNIIIIFTKISLLDFQL